MTIQWPAYNAGHCVVSLCMSSGIVILCNVCCYSVVSVLGYTSDISYRFNV